MALRIFNTLTRRKEDFVPLVAGEARMYVCGVTVYDLCHIGHARSAIVFDVMRRYLRFRDYRVTFVKNYTDVDDKIIRKRQRGGRRRHRSSRSATSRSTRRTWPRSASSRQTWSPRRRSTSPRWSR